MKTRNIVAIQSDPINTLDVNTDTTLLLASEAQKMGYKIFFYQSKDLNIKNGKIIAKGEYYKIEPIKKISKKKDMDLSSVKFILIRQNPPFNIDYITSLYPLISLSNKVKIINSPIGIIKTHEKLFSIRYKKFMPETIFTQSYSEIIKFKKKHKKIVIKATHGYGGKHIKFIKDTVKKSEIENFIKRHKHVMVQKYLNGVKYGDKRVFIINGKICGAIKRVPKKNSILSNISQGGRAYLTKLNTREIKISKTIAKDLKKNNIYFAGIDIIDNYLSGDINVTSPTGLKTFMDLSGLNLSKFFWSQLKSK